MVASRLADEYLTPPNAAAELGISVRTLARYRAEGTGPAYIKVGRRILYRICKLKEWLHAYEREPLRFAA